MAADSGIFMTLFHRGVRKTCCVKIEIPIA